MSDITQAVGAPIQRHVRPIEPTQADLLRATTEGKAAALKGQHFKTDCPYKFDNFEAMSFSKFNDTQRPMMDAWFDAWKANYVKPPWA